MRVGIPRGLLYFDYYPLWAGFFRSLGCEVVTSSPTSAEIAHAGVSTTCDEVCYPVKVFHGHVVELADKVDRIFIPRMFSVQPGTTHCPKLIGLPDMVRHSIPKLPPLITPFVNLRLGRKGLRRALNESAAGITSNPWRIQQAFRAGMREQSLYKRSLLAGRLPGVSGSGSEAGRKLGVAVIGHSYNLYDSHLNLQLIEKLQQSGYRVYTPEMLPDRAILQANKLLRKQLFWSAGRQVMGAAVHYSQRPDIRGIIHLASFGCGLESLITDMAERVARRQAKPFMLLTMDEHTGEAGLHTRLEAFFDMLSWREEISCV